MTMFMFVGMVACSSKQEEDKLPDVVQLKLPNDFYHEFQEYVIDSDIANGNFVISLQYGLARHTSFSTLYFEA